MFKPQAPWWLWCANIASVNVYESIRGFCVWFILTLHIFQQHYTVAFVLVKVDFPPFLVILNQDKQFVCCLSCFRNFFRSELWFRLDFCAAFFWTVPLLFGNAALFSFHFLSLSLLPVLSVNMASAHIRNNATARRHSHLAGRLHDVIVIYSAIILLRSYFVAKGALFCYLVRLLRRVDRNLLLRMLSTRIKNFTQARSLNDEWL